MQKKHKRKADTILNYTRPVLDGPKCINTAQAMSTSQLLKNLSLWDTQGLAWLSQESGLEGDSEVLLSLLKRPKTLWASRSKTIDFDCIWI